MILNKKPLTIAEAKSLCGKQNENSPISEYFKEFSLSSLEKAKKLKESILELNIIKLKEEQIIKIVDFIPKDKEELNKIVYEANLTEEESNKILELTKAV